MQRQNFLYRASAALMHRVALIAVAALALGLVGLAGCASESAATDEEGRPLPPDTREIEIQDVNQQIEAGSTGPRTGTRGYR